MTDALTTQVLEKWRQAAVDVRPADASAISAFEKRYAVRLPPELRRFFEAHDGMAENDMDDAMFRFWSLGEVVPVFEALPSADEATHEGYFVFADWSLWTHGYAVRLRVDQPDDVVIVGGALPTKVAGSFREFLEMYVRNPDSLFGSRSSGR